MRNFGVWLLEQERDKPQKEISPGSVKVHLPPTRQKTNYSCGASAFRAICSYFDIGPKDETKYIKALGTNPKDGTWYEKIVHVSKKMGLSVEAKLNMSLAELRNWLDHGVPVLCCIQAWGSPKEYSGLQSGHYVVAVGYDDKDVIFEDPSVDNGKRGYMNWRDFDRRWSDVDGREEKVVRHLGIAMWKPGPRTKQKLRHAVKIE